MRNVELFKKRKDFLEMIFGLYPDIKNSEYIKPIKDKIRDYRANNELSKDESQLAHYFLVSNAIFKELYPNRFIVG